MKFPAAIALSLIVTAASAGEPPNPNADTFNRSGYKRAPIIAADGKAAGLPGPAAVWNGAAWWQLLTYCGTMHAVHGLRLRAQGAAEAALKAQKDQGDRYYELAIDRLVADRKITRDQAWDDMIEAEDTYWTFSFMYQPLNFDQEALLCRFAEVRSKRS